MYRITIQISYPLNALLLSKENISELIPSPWCINVARFPELQVAVTWHQAGKIPN